jgi:uncharacterized protein YuzE
VRVVEQGRHHRRRDQVRTVDITYDAEADAAYIRLADGPSERQVHSIAPPRENGEIILDFDAGGKLIGIEVLGARAVVPDALLSGARAPGGAWEE